MSKKLRIFVIAVAFCVAAALLTGCSAGGNSPSAEGTPAQTEAAATPEPEITDPPVISSGTPEPEKIPTVQGTVSAKGERYRANRCEYSLPDGLTTGGTGRFDEELLSLYPGLTLNNGPLYTTQWMIQDSTASTQSGATVIGYQMLVYISEFDAEIPDFDSETRTPDEWYNFQFMTADEAESSKNWWVTDKQAERKTVDGCPAVRVSWTNYSDIDPDSYGECWIIDTPAGYTAVLLSYVELSWEKEAHKVWAEEVVSSFVFDR